METIISAFLLIFFAEMGDKTQFLALILATKYKIHQVLLGILIGIIFNHGLAVILAVFLSSFINISILKVIAGLMFLLFGFESFLLKLENEEDNNLKVNFGAVFTVALCFFLGELGDKTQITAMSVVFTGKNPVLVLIGTTLGMVCVSSLGIIAGKIINGKIPKNFVKRISGVCFILFGLDALLKSMPEKYMTTLNTTIMFICVFIILFAIHVRNEKLRNRL